MPRIDPDETARYLVPGDADDATAPRKGQALEQAIRYVFEQIPGVSCLMQNEKGAFESEEIDLLFANLAHDDGLLRFEPELLVEAKNWSRRVGAIEICWFATKMRRRNRKTGVLVAAVGITGQDAELKAARAQVMSALNEGQYVLVLTREELEAVSSGQRLASLLLTKRDHLIARQDIYIASREELREATGMLRLGTTAFAELLRGERRSRIEEALGHRVVLPRQEAARAEVLDSALREVQQLIEARRRDPELDPAWRDVRAALLHAAAIVVSWLADLGYTSADVIHSNAAVTGADRMRVGSGTELWQLLTGYYVEQLGADHPERPRETMLFELIAGLVGEIWTIDDYVPEPED